MPLHTSKHSKTDPMTISCPLNYLLESVICLFSDLSSEWASKWASEHQNAKSEGEKHTFSLSSFISIYEYDDQCIHSTIAQWIKSLCSRRVEYLPIRSPARLFACTAHSLARSPTHLPPSSREREWCSWIELRWNELTSFENSFSHCHTFLAIAEISTGTHASSASA